MLTLALSAHAAPLAPPGTVADVRTSPGDLPENGVIPWQLVQQGTVPTFDSVVTIDLSPLVSSFSLLVVETVTFVAQGPASSVVSFSLNLGLDGGAAEHVIAVQSRSVFGGGPLLALSQGTSQVKLRTDALLQLIVRRLGVPPPTPVFFRFSASGYLIPSSIPPRP